MRLMVTGSHDVNVSPDKRTILIHSEDVLMQTLKASEINYMLHYFLSTQTGHSGRTLRSRTIDIYSQAQPFSGWTELWGAGGTPSPGERNCCP
jgi:DNA mismatch repair ATPase MutL